MIEHIFNNGIVPSYQANFSLAVYCASRTGNSPEFKQCAANTGKLIAVKGWQLVYGGGLRGLMGTLANTAQLNGAPVVGVIPKKLLSIENTNHNCNELYIVDSMQERKTLMFERADAFLVLPGGIGTLEEFFEVWSWRHLNYHQKPIAIYNQNDFYTPLLENMRNCIKNGLMDHEQLDMLIIDDDLDSIFDQLDTVNF